MTQFCVYKNKNPRSQKDIPFLLDVQCSLLTELKTRVVVPLYTKRSLPGQPMSALMPIFMIGNTEVVMLTPQLAAITIAQLGAQIADLSARRNEIVTALDFLISGI